MARDSSNETIADLLRGFNSMQMQVGLLPGIGGGGGYAGIQTPPMKHPGQVAQEMSMQAAQQALQTMQSAHATRQMVAPNALPMTAMAAVSAPPLPPSIGQFGQDFGQRMQSIQQQYLSPWAAQGLSGMTGQSGFGNMPSPVMMTPPHMGIYRPPMGPPPSPFLARERPMFPTPMTPMHPPSMFQTPFEQRYQEGVTADETVFGMGVAGAGTAGRVATGFGAMAAGGAMGRGLMGRIGLPQFGKLGRMGGMIGGAALGFGALGGLAEQGVAGLLEPSVQARTLGQQLEVASRNFVVSGPQLSELGRGLSTRAAVGSTNRMQDMIQGGQIQGFNIRDMTRMTAQAGSMGMLDMAQSGEQIAQTMKNLARNLQVFMRLAQEPDVTRAMQQMASMRSMGLTIPETTMAMQNAYQFAKQSGTSMKGLMQTAGLPGAMTFQQLGMTAGLGMQVGMGARGMAQQAIAGGAYTPGQLAMAGGASGIGQSLTEAAGATLGVNFQTMAMMTRNAQGNLAIDPSRLRGLMSGKYNLQQQAEMGADNVARLGGERAITEMHSRVNELRDQMGRSLGPQGSAMLLIKQAMNTQQALGGPNVMALGGALQMIAPNMSQNQIRSLEVMATSRPFWRNMEQWSERRIGELRDQESRRREGVQSEAGIGGAISRAVSGLGEDAMAPFTAMRRGVSQFLTTRERRSRAIERGQRFVDTSEENAWQGMPGAERARGAQNRFMESGGYQRWLETTGSEYTRGPQRGTTTGQVAGALWNVSGGLAGATLAPQALGAQDNTLVAGAKARGGLGGTIADYLPSAYTLFAGPASAETNKRRMRENLDYVTGSQLLQGAGAMSTGEAVRLVNQNERTYKEFARKTGAKGDNSELQKNLRQELRDLFSSKVSLLTRNKGTTKSELKERLRKAARSSGMSEENAARFANSEHSDAAIAQATDEVKREGNRDVVAGAEAGAGSGLAGRMSADQLEGTIDQIRKVSKARDEEWGIGGTSVVEVDRFWGGMKSISKEEREQFKNTLTGGDPLKVLLASAIALEGKGQGKATESIRAQVRADMKKRGRPDSEYTAFLHEASGMAADKSTHKVLASFGARMAQSPDAVKQTQVVHASVMGGRITEGVMEGVTKLAGAGVTAFEGMASDELKTGGFKGRLQSMLGSQKQREAAGETFVKAARSALEEGISPDEQKKRMGRVQRLLTERGGGEGVTVGGGGEGGTAEREEQKTLENIRSMSEQAMKSGGKGGEAAMAAAVPTFYEGAIALKEAAEALKGTADGQRLDARMGKV